MHGAIPEIIEMLQPQDVQLTAKAFTDPIMQEEYWHGYFTEDNRPITARLIPLTPACQFWISEAQLYKDSESKALMRSYGYLRKPNGSEYLALISDPVTYNLAFDIAARYQQGKRYELVEIILILKSCLEGLFATFRSQLTTKGHGNLTPSSIFKSFDGTYKLGNFCTALAFNRDINGPYAAYIHPYVPQNKFIQPWQADIFDLGILLLHLCELQEPVDLKYPNLLRTPKERKDRFLRLPLEYNNEKLAELFSFLMQVNMSVGFEQISQKVMNSVQEIKLSLVGQVSAALQPQEAIIAAQRIQSSQVSVVLPPLGMLSLEDPPKAVRSEWLCNACTEVTASSFCNCGGKETFLCDGCYLSHFSKYPRSVHFVIPITAYGQHKVPGYFERLQSRSANITSAAVEIKKNIEEIDKSIIQVSSEIQTVLTAVYNYGTKVVSELQQLKSELEREINDSIAEAEKTMHEDSPILSNLLAKALREYSGDPTTLQIFAFSMNSDKIMEDIQSICCYTAINPRESEYVLPGLQGNRLITYHIGKAKYSSTVLSRAFSEGTVLCCIEPDKVLIVGSSPATPEASIVKVSNGGLSTISQMHAPRSYPGLIAVNKFVFAFGGGCVECEKYDTLNNVWLNLPKMNQAKSSFTPCRYKYEIYLIDITTFIEAFHLNSERFRTLQVDFRGLSGNSFSALKDGEIIIVTRSNRVGRWKLESPAIEVTEYRGIGAVSQCPPVAFQGEIHFVAAGNGSLHSYNLQTATVTRK